VRQSGFLCLHQVQRCHVLTLSAPKDAPKQKAYKNYSARLRRLTRQSRFDYNCTLWIAEQIVTWILTRERACEIRALGAVESEITNDKSSSINFSGGAFMADAETMTKTEVSEAQIAVHWREEEYYYPPQNFAAHANMQDPNVLERFGLDKFPDCFREYADMLDWFEPYHTVLDTSNAPFWKWFVGGKLNASYNCIDRHLAKHRNKAAFIFVPEPEEETIQPVTYQELYQRVNEMAALLQSLGLKTGDRVTLHMPMTPELPITMLACARLGVIHSQVFGGFSGQACGIRIADSGSRMLITMDGYWRSGTLIDHKANADVAVQTARENGQEVDKVLVWQRYPGKFSSNTPMVEGRDFFVSDLLKDFRGKKVAPVPMDSTAPLFLMYTSGTTGKPKGAQHSTGGYLAYVTGTSKWIQDIHPEDTYWCMADIGWITGHSYIVYGPLSCAATSVIYEGVPTFPDAGRPWRIAERLNVNIFHTAPTAIRNLRKLGPTEPRKYDYHFKNMTTVGEPIEPEAWRWYYHEVGKGEAVITDTWWLTETGGFLCTTVPAIHPMKPGSAGPGAPGIHPVIYDENGNEIAAGSGIAGNICIRNPWPGIMQTVWGDSERYVRQYYSRYNRNPKSQDWRDWPFLCGDGAVQAADGYYRILGRIDDVINVAGHRLGTKEIESACLTVPEVAEAAVVPVADEMKGRVPVVYIALKPGIEPDDDIVNRVVKANEELIGKIARPKFVYIVPDMPKTRSGKIMRRVLAAISNRRDVGDVTTLANPGVVAEIREMVQGQDQTVRADVLPEDIAKFGQNE
jgi:acetyl-CoA synthetase